ncbi:uncharacterized protein LOC117180735 [Belonocnema kinseyi]|uniref:uncharacterized protein LOC117180735 n=1 Tax=Belonocnema kinseyi TaxID=2817044 RepID=UPI00143DF7E5|nr:uncharacterized protein LOC117180735 [Belonocnema kinseyi]
MYDHGLDLTAEKTELVIVTKKYIPLQIPMKVGSAVTTTKAAIKHLSIWMDNRLSFHKQLKQAADKAASVTSALSRLMVNVSGPRPSKCRLLMTVAQSIMLYGAGIWADALKKKTHCKLLAVSQRRGALRIACAYRTVSEPAILVIAGTIPIDLLAQEKKKVFLRKTEVTKAVAKAEARAATMEEWQQRWSLDHLGRWTNRLISELSNWLNRRHGETYYYLTQFLSGHSYFRDYLYKRGKVSSPKCGYCKEEEDDPKHTFFESDRWSDLKHRLESKIEEIIPDNVVELMLLNEEWWEKVATYVETILRKKKQEGQLSG